WHRLATAVMRRPLVIGAAIIALLLVLGAPFLGVHFGQPEARALPAAASTRVTSDVLTKDFRSGESNALSVVAPAGGGDAAITAYAESLSRVPQVARVDALTGSFVAGARVAPANQANQRFANPTGTWMSVVP